MVTTTVPGPDAESCAYAWLVPSRLTAATSAAIQRVMCDLLCVFISLLIWTGAERRTIGQKRDLLLRRVWDLKASRSDDDNLVLLADMAIGHPDISKNAWIRAKLLNN